MKDKPIDYEIVIDLPTRIAKVQQAKAYVDIALTKFVGDEDRQRGIGTQINASQGEKQPSSLPQFLRFWKFPGHRELIFELDQGSLEYRKVAAVKWKDHSNLK